MSIYSAHLIRDDRYRLTNHPIDIDILQVALTLEHLESEFYSQELEKYDGQAFADAEYSPDVRDRFVQTSQDEARHVAFLSGVLGDQAVKPCEYIFPYTDPHSFAALSMIMDVISHSAYPLAAQDIYDRYQFTAAGIRRQSGVSPWASVHSTSSFEAIFTPPLPDARSLTLIAPLIKSCPQPNVLYFTENTLPALTLSDSTPAPGSVVTLSVDGVSSKTTGTAYVAWLDGLSVFYSDYNTDGTTTVPAELQGPTVYCMLVKQKDLSLGGGNIVSGFAVATVVAN